MIRAIYYELQSAKEELNYSNHNFLSNHAANNQYVYQMKFQLLLYITTLKSADDLQMTIYFQMRDVPGGEDRQPAAHAVHLPLGRPPRRLPRGRLRPQRPGKISV